jgi:hypothetical protein
LNRLIVVAALSVGSNARAEPATTRAALDRLEEVLELRIDDGSLRAEEVVPAIVVSTMPRYEESKGWFSARAVDVLGRTFGTSGLRLCEACMAARTFVGEGRLERTSGPVGLDEVVRLDEHASGVSIRIVDLRTARVIFAQNVDPELIEHENSARMMSLSEELERRARGDSITQAFVDVAIYPGQHFSLDWTEQWGATNANLSGVVLSLFDPILGFGGAYYRCLDFLNILVGFKVIVSLPTALVKSISDEEVDELQNLLTGVGVIKIPFGRSNYGAVMTVSTNGEFGVGISLMNISVLPVLP